VCVCAQAHAYLSVSRVCGVGLLILAGGALVAGVGVAMKRRCDVVHPDDEFGPVRGQSTEHVPHGDGFRYVNIRHEAGI